jgi:outer membrane protein assembly factor BamB
MRRRTPRRAVLSSLGALALAGCLGDDGDPVSEETPPNHTLPSTTATGTPTPSTAGTDDGPEPPERIDSDWPVPWHDPGHSNYASGAAGPTEPVAELWQLTTEASLSRPVVADGTVFVGGDDGVLMALDGRTGESRWTARVGGSVRVPQVTDEYVLVDVGDDAVAVDRETHAERWRLGKPGRAPPLVASHGVYAVADGDPPGVVAYHRADGSERWRRAIDRPFGPTMFASDDAVFVPTGTHERVPWVLAPGDGSFVYDTPTGRGNHFPGEQCVHEGCVFASDGFYGDLWAFEAGSGYEQRWRATVGETGGDRLTPGHSHVYAHAPGNRTLTAFDRVSGEVAWTAEGIGRLAARPVVGRDVVLVDTGEAFYCLDPADGTERWRLSSDGIGARFALVDDVVYAVASTRLCALRPP